MGTLSEAHLQVIRPLQARDLDGTDLSVRATTTPSPRTTATPMRSDGTFAPMIDPGVKLSASFHVLTTWYAAPYVCAARCHPVDNESTTQTETATQTKEDPAAAGRRLAEEVLPKQ